MHIIRIDLVKKASARLRKHTNQNLNSLTKKHKMKIKKQNRDATFYLNN